MSERKSKKKPTVPHKLAVALMSKRFMACLHAAQANGPVELEGFFETWIKDHIRDYSDGSFTRDLWRRILDDLYDERYA